MILPALSRHRSCARLSTAFSALPSRHVCQSWVNARLRKPVSYRVAVWPPLFRNETLRTVFVKVQREKKYSSLHRSEVGRKVMCRIVKFLCLHYIGQKKGVFQVWQTVNFYPSLHRAEVGRFRGCQIVKFLCPRYIGQKKAVYCLPMKKYFPLTT